MNLNKYFCDEQRKKYLYISNYAKQFKTFPRFAEAGLFPQSPLQGFTAAPNPVLPPWPGCAPRIALPGSEIVHSWTFPQHFVAQSCTNCKFDRLLLHSGVFMESHTGLGWEGPQSHLVPSPTMAREPNILEKTNLWDAFRFTTVKVLPSEGSGVY